MGHHASASGVGTLEVAVRKVLRDRTRCCVFFDTKRTYLPTFVVLGSGPEMTVAFNNPERYWLVGTYNREFSVAELIEDAQTTEREFSLAPLQFKTA